MKKLAVIFAGLLLAIGLSSCSNEEEKECNHKWTDATCTEPSICSKCNETGVESLGHQWERATCESPKTCNRCGATKGEKREHEWLEATCESPKTCNHCGATEGEKLEHEWLEATCENPKTCNHCGTTEGEKLEHEWSEPTCTKSMRCIKCSSLQRDTALGHDYTEWEKADELLPCQSGGQEKQTCNRCGNEEFRARTKEDCTPGEWVITNEPTLDSRDGVRKNFCTVCGEALETQRFTVTGAELLNLYKKESKTYTYEEIARYPDQYKGKPAVFKGEVIQILEYDEGTDFRVNITQGSYFWDDPIYVCYIPAVEQSARILEDDIVTMYGYLYGLYTYESVLGSEITIPLYVAEFIEIN